MKTHVFGRPIGAIVVALVLVATMILQYGIVYSLTAGKLAAISGSAATREQVQTIWALLQPVLIAAMIGLWVMNWRRAMFSAIVVTNGMLTAGLLISTWSVFDVLSNITQKSVDTFLLDVLGMAISNVLVFSIWYWVIDPPGIDDDRPDDEPWDFLFPQRAGAIPGHEAWRPRYLDYLFVAFTTSLAFSPTDTLPLTPRAKMLMLLQAVISTVTIVVIAGTAINNL